MTEQNRLAAGQRRLAEEARTNNGQAEHEDIADWLEERADAIPGRTLHCSVGCDDGACEICPCCSAGFCVYGLDGLPEDPEDVGRWLEIAAQHNPVAKLLAAQARPMPTREEIVHALPALLGSEYPQVADAVLALLNGAES